MQIEYKVVSENKSLVLGLAISIISGISYYCSWMYFRGDEPGDIDTTLWLATLITAYILSVVFKADWKTVASALVLNPIVTVLIDFLFWDQFPHSHCEDTSLEFSLFRLTLKTVIETLPVLLGFATWMLYVKLKNRKGR